jgi:hypothetical protein
MTTKVILLIVACVFVTSSMVRIVPPLRAQTQGEMNADCTKILAESPWEENTNSHLNSFKHILVMSVSEDHWEDRGPNRYSLHHFDAKVTKVFKGDWKAGEKIAIVHAVDSPALTTTNAAAGHLIYVFTNRHINSEIGLETGEFGNYIPYIERILQCVFP